MVMYYFTPERLTLVMGCVYIAGFCIGMLAMMVARHFSRDRQ